MRRQKGVSLIELMLIAVIIIILTVIALPNFQQFMQRYRLVTSIQSIYYNLQFARSEALKLGTPVFVSFTTGSSWCYGINSGSVCSCSTPSGCNLGTYTVPSSTLTTLSLSGFSSPVSFDGSRGGASASGTITLTTYNGSSSMGIDLSTVGSFQICSNNISGYPVC